MPKSIRADPKMAYPTEVMYENIDRTVVAIEQLTNWFRMEIGTWQCCFVSHILFGFSWCALWVI